MIPPDAALLRVAKARPAGEPSAAAPDRERDTPRDDRPDFDSLIADKPYHLFTAAPDSPPAGSIRKRARHGDCA
ncbi:MAG TPA: hypothetical protein VM891_12510, partial [Amaricoccus sp.]|nr:hypothetical protein [Amaricoccus sp.]